MFINKKVSRFSLLLKVQDVIVKVIILTGCSLVVLSCNETHKVSPSFLPHPNDPSKKIEYYLKRPRGNGSSPAIIFIHGHQVGSKPGGRVFADWGVLHEYASRGFVTVAVSQPGYGASEGPPDYCGAFTQNAVIAVIDHLVNKGLVTHDQIILEGLSRGAVVAGLVAAKKESIKGIVLISGVFDFIKYKEMSKAETAKKSVMAAIAEETGNSEDSLESRSVIHYAEKIKANTLILNGANDKRTCPQQARELAGKINKYGGNASFVIFKNTGHQIPLDERTKVIDSFLAKLIILK